MKDITQIWNEQKRGVLPPQNKRQAATLALWEAWLEEEPDDGGYETMCIEIPDALTELYNAASRPPNRAIE
jgi:hypothetical protein